MGRNWRVIEMNVLKKLGIEPELDHAGYSASTFQLMLLQLKPGFVPIYPLNRKKILECVLLFLECAYHLLDR